MQGAEISQISTFVLVSRQKFSGNSDFHPEILCFPLCTGDDRSAEVYCEHTENDSRTHTEDVICS